MASIRCWYSSTSGSASSSPSAGGSPAGGSAGAPSPSPPSSPSSPSPPSGCGFGSSYSSGNDPSRRSRNIPPGLDVTSGTRSTASGASPASSSSPIASSNVHPGLPECPRGRRDDASAARTRGAGAPRLPGSGLRASSTPCVRPGALVRVETRVSRSESRRRPASAKTGTKKLAGDERRGLKMTLWPISSALRRRTPGSDAGVSKMNSAGFQICTERASDGGPVCDVAGARAPSRARPPPFFARDPIRDRADAAP